MQDEHKRTILLLTTPFRPNIGGVETHLDDLISVGALEKWNFCVLTYQPLVTNALGALVERIKGCIIFRIPWIRLNLFLKFEKYPALEFIYLFPPLFIAGLFYLIFQAFNIRKIHAQGLIAGTVGVVLGKLFNKKVILSTHSIYNFPKKGIYRRFVKILFNNCEKVLCLSYQSQREILDLGINEMKVRVFTYWIDQEIFHPFPQPVSRKFIGEDSKVFICLFVGRLVKGKGIPELLETAKLMQDKLKFIIIGDGPLKDSIINVSKTQNNIVFKGKVNNAELPKYYCSADVLLVPSTHEEGYGRVILEALSCGLPVIATNRGGIKEYVNEKIGILINAKPSNIRETLLSIIKNKTKLLTMKKEAYKYARANFNKKNSKYILKNYE